MPETFDIVRLEPELRLQIYDAYIEKPRVRLSASQVPSRTPYVGKQSISVLKGFDIGESNLRKILPLLHVNVLVRHKCLHRVFATKQTMLDPRDAFSLIALIEEHRLGAIQNLWIDYHSLSSIREANLGALLDRMPKLRRVTLLCFGETIVRESPDNVFDGLYLTEVQAGVTLALKDEAVKAVLRLKNLHHFKLHAMDHACACDTPLPGPLPASDAPLNVSAFVEPCCLQRRSQLWRTDRADPQYTAGIEHAAHDHWG